MKDQGTRPGTGIADLVELAADRRLVILPYGTNTQHTNVGDNPDLPVLRSTQMISTNTYPSATDKQTLDLINLLLGSSPVTASLVCEGKTLRMFTHKGEDYAESPTTGDWVLRIKNNTAARLSVVVSVDGVNVIDGTDASYEGQGYALSPHQTTDIPGWRRSDSKVAKFSFAEQEKSYAAQVGKGVTNVGVIGIAVFAEKARSNPWTVTYPHNNWNNGYGTNNLNGSVYRGATKGLDNRRIGTNSVDLKTMYKGDDCDNDNLDYTVSSTVDPSTPAACYTVNSAGTQPDMTTQVVRMVTTTPTVGTAYGKETTFHTTTVDFERATTEPYKVLSIRYAVTDMLRSWGVPVDFVPAPTPPAAPNPFPASKTVNVPAPKGWTP